MKAAGMGDHTSIIGNYSAKDKAKNSKSGQWYDLEITAKARRTQRVDELSFLRPFAIRLVLVDPLSISPFQGEKKLVGLLVRHALSLGGTRGHAFGRNNVSENTILLY
jgi:hypothetical protein